MDFLGFIMYNRQLLMCSHCLRLVFTGSYWSNPILPDCLSLLSFCSVTDCYCYQRRQRQFKVGGDEAPKCVGCGTVGWCVPLPIVERSGEGQIFSFVISKRHILVTWPDVHCRRTIRLHARQSPRASRSTIVDFPGLQEQWQHMSLQLRASLYTIACVRDV